MKRIDYYKTYYENLSPSNFKVEKEDDKIVISGIGTHYLKGFDDKDVKQYKMKQSKIDKYENRYEEEGGIISGKTLKEYIENTNYGNDLSFVEYINDNDKFDLKNIDINAQIQKDGTLKDYVNNSEDFKPNEKETDWLNKTPIIIGDNSYENDVVLDGYHRIKQAQANKEKTILAYVKASNYADGGQVPMNVIRFDKKGKEIDRMTWDEVNKYEKSPHIHYNIMNGRYEVKNHPNPKDWEEFWLQQEAEDFSKLKYDENKDAFYGRKKYEALTDYKRGGRIKPNNIVSSLQSTIDEVKNKIIEDADITQEQKEKLQEIRAYVVNSSRGKAWYRKGYFSVPLWSYDKQEMSSKDFKKKYHAWDKKWFDSHRGRKGYFIYYVAHELAHFLCDITNLLDCNGHKVGFYDAFLKLCPLEYQFYELNYIKKSDKYGVPTYEQCKLTPIEEQTPSSEFCLDGNFTKALDLWKNSMAKMQLT